jgi:hypothetical protein
MQNYKSIAVFPTRSGYRGCDVFHVNVVPDIVYNELGRSHAVTLFVQVGALPGAMMMPAFAG